MDSLNLASFEPLLKLEGRGDCPKCKSKRKYFCYDCVVPLNKDAQEVPRLDLPVDVTIIRHPKEKRSKSSVIPSAIIAPDNVEILHTIEVPDQTLGKYGDDPDSVVLMFPSDQATDVTKMSREELLKIKKVILIDSTWSQTRYYLRQEKLQKIKHVKIQTEKTAFWRYQKGNIADTSLATIEALYFFFRDYETSLRHKGSYEEYQKLGKWDNILYYYAFQFQLIQSEYRDGKLKDQPFRRIPGYVKYEENNESSTRVQDCTTGEWKDWMKQSKEQKQDAINDYQNKRQQKCLEKEGKAEAAEQAPVNKKQKNDD